MPSVWCWSAIKLSNNQSLVFSSIFNRSYLLNNQQLADNQMLYFLGLAKFFRIDHLVDEADCVIHQFSELSRCNRIKVSYLSVTFYRIIHNVRFVPLPFILGVVQWVAMKQSAKKLTASDIGKIIQSIEFQANMSECFPRAILTAYYCLRYLRICDFYIGFMAPTKMMHAWCVVNKVIPYEHTSEHFQFEPALKVRLTF